MTGRPTQLLLLLIICLWLPPGGLTGSQHHRLMQLQRQQQQRILMRQRQLEQQQRQASGLSGAGDGCWNDGAASTEENHTESHSGGHMNYEHTVFAMIKESCTPDSRPVYNASVPVVVYFASSLTQILGFDERKQILTANFWVVVEYVDERIRWTTSRVAMQSVTLPSRDIWLPDLVLYNTAGDYVGYFPSDISVSITSNGTIKWMPAVTSKSHCAVDLTLFPFDRQLCSLKFASWTYDMSQLDLRVHPSMQPMLKEFNIQHGEWNVTRVWLGRNITSYPLLANAFSEVLVYICMRRHSVFYLINVALPTLVFICVTFFSYWVPFSSGEKVTFCVSMMTTFSIYSTLLVNKLPTTSDSVAILSSLVAMGMVNASVATASSVMTLKLVSYRHRPSGLLKRIIIACGEQELSCLANYRRCVERSRFNELDSEDEVELLRQAASSSAPPSDILEAKERQILRASRQFLRGSGRIDWLNQLRAVQWHVAASVVERVVGTASCLMTALSFAVMYWKVANFQPTNDC